MHTTAQERVMCHGHTHTIGLQAHFVIVTLYTIYPHTHAAHTDTELYCTPDRDPDSQPCSPLYALHTVTVRPIVTLSPSVSGPVSVGDVVMFTCTASGGVPSEYSFRWFNGSVEVMSGDSVRITSDGDTSTLMLMVRPDDFVNYTCFGNNTFIEASESIMLVEACKLCCHDDAYQTELTDIACSQLVLPPPPSLPIPVHHSRVT